jgi:hypothetical protein
MAGETKATDVVHSTTDRGLGTVEDLPTKEDVLDDAARFLATAESYPPLTSERERQLVRKLDRWMIPLVSPMLYRQQMLTLTDTDAS